MALDLRSAAPPTVSLTMRPLRHSDASCLARLMFDAYRGTIDDEGGTLDDAMAEVEKTLGGGYGEALLDASFAVEGPSPQELLSASIITLFRGEPLLAFSMTSPAAQGRGLAGALIMECARALAELGHERLLLVVTRGNERAERLYEQLGFRTIDPSA